MQKELNAFLSGVEKKAYEMARFATKDTDLALDIVQDSMMVLAQKYSDKSPEQWPALFFRILQNKIIDFHRRSSLKNRIFSWFGFIEDNYEAYQAGKAARYDQPEITIENSDLSQATMQAIEQLPARQQQAFLLRQWQGLSVAETATAMNISEGSVKTHYSRALQQLKHSLQDLYEDMA